MRSADCIRISCAVPSHHPACCCHLGAGLSQAFPGERSLETFTPLPQGKVTWRILPFCGEAATPPELSLSSRLLLLSSRSLKWPGVSCVLKAAVKADLLWPRAPAVSHHPHSDACLQCGCPWSTLSSCDKAQLWGCQSSLFHHPLCSPLPPESVISSFPKMSFSPAISLSLSFPSSWPSFLGPLKSCLAAQKHGHAEYNLASFQVTQPLPFSYSGLGVFTLFF